MPERIGDIEQVHRVDAHPHIQAQVDEMLAAVRATYGLPLEDTAGLDLREVIAMSTAAEDCSALEDGREAVRDDVSTDHILARDAVIGHLIDCGLMRPDNYEWRIPKEMAAAVDPHRRVDSFPQLAKDVATMTRGIEAVYGITLQGVEAMDLRELTNLSVSAEDHVTLTDGTEAMDPDKMTESEAAAIERLNGDNMMARDNVIGIMVDELGLWND